MSSCCPDNIIVKKHNSIEYVFDLYYKDNLYISDNLTDILVSIKDITRSGWGEPGCLAEKWVDLIDVLIFVKENDIAKGFVIAKLLSDDLVALVATVLTRDKQSSGLGTLLNSFALRDLCFKRIKKNYLKLFSPLYFVFRTPNPRLFSIAVNNLRVYPNLKGCPPSNKQIKAFEYFVRIMSPDAPVDRVDFIAKNSLRCFPDLIYSPDAIPWSSDSKVNDFFREKVRLPEQEGNTVVVVGCISLRDALSNLKRIF
jgi:hypothetical protein